MQFATITPSIKLSLSPAPDCADAVFGPGIASLCRGVAETGSLNKAAKDMGMAYSKAWRIIKEAEESFGVQLLDRNGAHGSTLTADGAALLETYDKLQADVASYARERLKAIAQEAFC